VTVADRLRVALLLLLAAAGAARAVEPAELLDGFGRARGMVETPVACHLLDLWVAATPAQRAQGLMYVRRLGEYEGMLFPNRRPAIVNMWMKNTYIPLDMLFIREDGRIVGIAANAPPLSEQTIGSGVPVIAVLELAGGFAERHGVTTAARFQLLD
jgi:hypothetical protein